MQSSSSPCGVTPVRPGAALALILGGLLAAAGEPLLTVVNIEGGY